MRVARLAPLVALALSLVVAAPVVAAPPTPPPAPRNTNGNADGIVPPAAPAQIAPPTARMRGFGEDIVGLVTRGGWYARGDTYVAKGDWIVDGAIMQRLIRQGKLAGDHGPIGATSAAATIAAATTLHAVVIFDDTVCCGRKWNQAIALEEVPQTGTNDNRVWYRQYLKNSNGTTEDTWHRLGYLAHHRFDYGGINQAGCDRDTACTYSKNPDNQEPNEPQIHNYFAVGQYRDNDGDAWVGQHWNAYIWDGSGSWRGPSGWCSGWWLTSSGFVDPTPHCVAQ
jgi:hypothetical protein